MIFSDWLASRRAILNESVLPAVQRAAEILGDDMKTAVAINDMDPYKDKRMTPAIARWLRDGHVQSPDEHSADIEEFKSLRGRLKDLRVPATNLDRKRKVRELLDFDPTAARTPAEIQSWNREASQILDPKRDLSDEGLEVVGRHGGYTMYRLATEKDCKVPIVRNSMGWCVTKKSFGQYGGPPYFAIVRDSDRSPFAMVIPAYIEDNTDQAVRNANNTGRLAPADMRKIRPLLRLALPRTIGHRYVDTIHNDDNGKARMPKTVPEDINEIMLLMKDMAIGPGEWPEAEDAIARNAEWSYVYACDVIKGPWQPGEEAISKNAEWSCRYAYDIIKGPWPMGEEAISRNTKWSYWYAYDVIRGPWPMGEEAISKDAEQSYLYAHDVIRGPWTRGEEAISKDAQWSYYYARNVVMGPWPIGEEIIAKNAQWSHLYARDVIKRP